MARDLDDEAEADMELPAEVRLGGQVVREQHQEHNEHNVHNEHNEKEHKEQHQVQRSVVQQQSRLTSTFSVQLERLPAQSGFVTHVCAAPSLMPAASDASGAMYLQLTLAAPASFVEVLMPGSTQIYKYPVSSSAVRINISRSALSVLGRIDFQVRSSVRVQYAWLTMSSNVGFAPNRNARPCVSALTSTTTSVRTTYVPSSSQTSVPYYGHVRGMYFGVFFAPLSVFLLVLIILSIVRCCCCRRRNNNNHVAEPHHQEHHHVFSVPPPTPQHVHMYAPVPASFPSEYVAKPQITQLSVYPTHY